MQTKRPLKAKTQLRAKKALKPALRASKRKKQAKPTITKLKREAITWFNLAVKYRDSEYIEGQWLFQCITCNKRVLFIDRDGTRFRNAHAGHFMPCHKEPTRFEEENVSGQCGACNYNQGEQYKYGIAVDLKYGAGTASRLERLSRTKGFKHTVESLQQVIDDAKTEVEFYKKQEL